MKHLIEIDDKTTAGKSLLEFPRDLSRNNKYISIATEGIPSVKDAALFSKIKKGLKSGLADRSKVLKKAFKKHGSTLKDD